MFVCGGCDKYRSVEKGIEASDDVVSEKLTALCFFYETKH